MSGFGGRSCFEWNGSTWVILLTSFLIPIVQKQWLHVFARFPLTSPPSGYFSQVVYYLPVSSLSLVCLCCHVADVSFTSESHLVQASTSSEEKVPFSVWDFFSLTHDFTTQHERKHQLVLFKQASETYNTSHKKTKVHCLTHGFSYRPSF